MLYVKLETATRILFYNVKSRGVLSAANILKALLSDFQVSNHLNPVIELTLLLAKRILKK